MVSNRVTIKNKEGLHMRPAGVMAKETTKFHSKVTFVHGDRRVNAKSVMNLIAAGIKKGDEITVECEGEDEAEALKYVVELIESGIVEE